MESKAWSDISAAVNLTHKRSERTPSAQYKRSEYHARLCLAHAGNRGFEVIYANEVSERSERERESRAQALRRCVTARDDL